MMLYQAASPNAKVGGCYIREMQITQSYNGNHEINLTLMPDSWDKTEYFMRLWRGDVPPNNTMGLHIVEDEWICIYCSSPNPIHHRHCSQCGAPRGFILRS
jgi:hypothetical protein